MTSPDYKEQMNRIAKASIEHYLVHGRALYCKPSNFTDSEQLLGTAKRVFCSLTNNAGETRGCRSAVAEAKSGGSLFDSIRISAIRSAFLDQRFSPCNRWILDQLNLQVYALNDATVRTIKTSDVDALAEFTKLGDDRTIAILNPDTGVEAAAFLPGVLSELRGSGEFIQRLAKKGGIGIDLGASTIALAAIETSRSIKQRYVDIGDLQPVNK